MNSSRNLRESAWLLDYRWNDLDGDVLSPQDVADSIVHAATSIQEEVKMLSQLYPAEELQPYFCEVSNVAGGAKQLVTEFDLEEYGWPICKRSEDATHLESALWEMTNAVAKHIGTTMPLSGLPTGTITPDLVKQNPQAAIQYAFTIFEDHLRKRIRVGPEVYGENLINEAFGNRGHLTYGATQSEDRGVRNLMSGAYATFRNPHMHRIIGDDDQMVSSIITVVDLLTQLVDEAKDK
jgi:hypothetical protein